MHVLFISALLLVHGLVIEHERVKDHVIFSCYKLCIINCRSYHNHEPDCVGLTARLLPSEADDKVCSTSEVNDGLLP